MKKGYFGNIEQLTTENENFRKVLYTAKHCQLVLMCLKPLEEIGLETHEGGDQFFRFESGQGRVVIDESTYEVKNGDCIIVPAGSKHNVSNTSDSEDLKLYTLYTPPHHKDQIVRATKEEAVASAPEFDGATTE